MEEVSLELWDRLIQNDASATFFQTPVWHRLASRHFGTETVALEFSFGNVEAVLPLQRRKKALWSVHSSPFGTYTALVCGSKLEAAQLHQVRARLRSLNLDLASSPFTLNPVTVGHETEASTRVIGLEALDPAAISKGWNRNHRRSLAAGMEAGITIRLADKAADVDAYFRIYRGLAESWGDKARTLYPDRFFHSLWEELRTSAAMKIWLAECEGEIVAGRICFYHRFHAVEWHAAALDPYREKGANHLLIHTILADAKAAGFRIYDFNPNPGLPQVDHFKRGFGTDVLTFRSCHHSHGLYAGIRAIRGG